MKISLKKDMAWERLRARQRLDDIFLPKINEVTGGKAALYTVKYTAAMSLINGVPSPLIADQQEAEAIIAKNALMQSSLALIETERQALQAKIDQAETTHELALILSL